MNITIGNLNIEYRQSGNGPDVLLLHGWGGNIESLHGLEEEMSKYCKVTSISFPGFGNSDLPESNWSLKNYSLFVEELIISIGLKKPIIIGHSFGGKVALKFALEFPDLLSKLVLINSSGIEPRNSLKKKIFGALSKILKPILPEKLKSWGYKYIIRETDYSSSGKLKETFKTIVNEHFDMELEQIHAPVLIIWSGKDGYVPLWMGEKLNLLIPNSKLTVVEGETHGLPLYNPRKVAEIAKDFIVKPV